MGKSQGMNIVEMSMMRFIFGVISRIGFMFYKGNTTPTLLYK